MVKSYSYLDIEIASVPVGRIVIECFNEQAPKAVENYTELCRSHGYQGTYIHRVVKNFMIQGGNTEYTTASEGDYPYGGADQLSKGGKSIFASEDNPDGDFDDENHSDMDKQFLVCMAHNPPSNKNRSQFFITTDHTKHLSYNYTVFGRVVHGKSVCRTVEKTPVYSNKTGEANCYLPTSPVVVAECGDWKAGDKCPVYDCCNDQIAGDYYEEYPDDNEIPGLNLDDPDAAYRVTNVVKQSGSALYKEKRYQDALFKYKKAMRYCNELIPDETKHESMYNKFLDLKKTIYLNLSMVTLAMNQYQKCIDYCGYLLEYVQDNDPVKLTTVQMSKVFYRLGKSYEALGNYTEALEALKHGQAVNQDDPAIKSELKKVESLKRDNEKGTRQKLQNFFN